MTMTKRLIPQPSSLYHGLLISTFLLLAACSKQETADRLPDGQYPMTFTAQMGEPQSATRATTDNSWVGSEEIAVQVGNEVKKYTAATNGVLSAASGVTPWYWQNTTETKSVTAWHSHTYSANRPTSFTVQEDQSVDGYQQSDLIYASREVTFTDKRLTFKHLPAKVVIHLKAGPGIGENEVANATVSIENQATTSGTITIDGTVAQAVAGSAAIAPQAITAESGYQKSTQALLIPQQMQNKKFIKIVIGSDAAARNFYYTPTATNDANLIAGKLHRFNLVVKSSGVEFASSTVEEWDNDSEKGKGEVEPLPPAEIGDFYYKFGNYSTDFEGTDINPCIGIIYRVEPDGKSGMIVGLTESDWDWFSASTYCNYYFYPSGTTGWFLPSVLELQALVAGYCGLRWVSSNANSDNNEINNWIIDGYPDSYMPDYSAYSASRQKFEEKLLLASGDVFMGGSHWTASEKSVNFSWHIDLINSKTSSGSKNKGRHVRCIRAF